MKYLAHNPINYVHTTFGSPFVVFIRVLQWVPIPMGTQYPPIPMGKWVGNGYGLGRMGGYEGPGLYND